MENKLDLLYSNSGAIWFCRPYVPIWFCPACQDSDYVNWMNTEFIWWRHWAGQMIADHWSGIDACVAKVDGIFPTPDWEPPEKNDKSVPGKRNFQSASKLSKVLHNRIRELTLSLRLYGLGAFSTQRLRRLWTWIRTCDTLMNLDTNIWYTLVPLGYCSIAFPPPLYTTKYHEIYICFHFHKDWSNLPRIGISLSV